MKTNDPPGNPMESHGEKIQSLENKMLLQPQRLLDEIFFN